VTRGLPASFAHTDEYYRFVSAPRAHVLLRLGAGGPPLAWVRHEGRGRVFYSALGHPIGAWADPQVRRLVAQGVRWVAHQR
jgi:type 1 glutamine amidotransferase